MSRRTFKETDWRDNAAFQSLCVAICACKTPEQLASFLRDLATLSELQAWSERWLVVNLVAQGMSYRDIAKKTGASTATVTRVAKFLNDGEGGYRAVLQNTSHHHALRRTREAVGVD